LVDFQSAFIHPLTHVEFIAGDGSHVNSAEFVAAEEIFPSEAAHDKQKKLAGYFFVKFPLYYSKKKIVGDFSLLAARVVSRPSAGSFRAPGFSHRRRRTKDKKSLRVNFL
jgi:hypothetical protein